MKLIDSLRRSGRSLSQSKIRTLLTASAIGVGTFALTLTLAASNGAQSFVDKIITDNFDPAELIVANDPAVLNGSSSAGKPKEYDDSFTATGNNGITTQVKQLADKDIAKLKSTQGVEEVRQAVSPPLQYVTGPNSKKFIGTAYTFSPAQHPDLKAGSIPQPLDGKQVLIPESYVSSLGFVNAGQAIGSSVTFVIQKGFDAAAVQSVLSGGATGASSGTGTSGNAGSATAAGAPTAASLQKAAAANSKSVPFSIAGVYKAPVTSQPGTENILYVGLGDALELNDYSTQNTPTYHKYSYAYVRVKDGADSGKLTAVQNKIKSYGYQAQSVKDTQKFLNQIIGVLRGIVAAFGAIAVIASVFGIVNTMYISVLQRTREIGLMKALGMRRREIGRLFRYEAAWIGFLGGVLGSLAAFGLGTLLNPWITDKLDLGAGEKLLIFKPAQIAILILILVVIAVLAGLLPARKAAKLDPIEALRTE